MTVPVYSDEEVVAEVEYNQELDHWDGHNFTCGSTGRHLGLTQLDDGRYVLIHGTQWQGEENTAEIISASRAVKEIIQSGNTEMFKRYPELQELREALPQEGGDKKQSRSFSIRVNRVDTPAQIEEKITKLREQINTYFS
jgi:hypothetical protein